MNIIVPSLSFLGGIVATALINEIVARFFSAPKISVAISELSLCRTKHRLHRSIPVSDDLRLQTADSTVPFEYIKWYSEFICEHDLDLSILETIENEKTYTDNKSELDAIINSLNENTVRDRVLSLGRDISLINTCLNALIYYPNETPNIPLNTENEKSQFPITINQSTEDGKNLEYYHLDLPGNAFPIVGSRDGDKNKNEKVKSLRIAMSICDAKLLRDILKLAVKYCEVTIEKMKIIRSELNRIKNQQKYVEIQLLLTNLGKSAAFLSTKSILVIEKQNTQINLRYINDKNQDEKNPDYRIMIKDKSRKLLDWIPQSKDEIKPFESIVETIVIEPSQTLDLHFVSNEQISQQSIDDAIRALQTGYTSCLISLFQYIPKKSRVFAKFGKFVKEIKSIQKYNLKDIS